MPMKALIKTNIHRSLLIVMALVTLFSLPSTPAYADTFDEQIRALQAEVNSYQNEAGRLRAQANTLQNQVNALQAEKNALQRQITLNEAHLVQLHADIKKNEEKLEQQKQVLAENLKSMYLDSQITSLEMVASSKSISDFIDKQEYRNKIRERIQKNMTQIRATKDELNRQKTEVEARIADQKVQRDVLAAKEAEQANLLAQTQGEEAAYQQLSSERNSRIAELRAQQAAANLKWGGNVTYQPRGGGYPSYWADIPMDSTIDDWGMYNRECVSFTAFKVAVSGRHMPYWGGIGNANQWPGNARRADIPVDRNPQVGDVAIWPVGYYGHAMYVEAVMGNGDIMISEYNYDWTGRYSERYISNATWNAQGFEFIHFR